MSPGLHANAPMIAHGLTILGSHILGLGLVLLGLVCFVTPRTAAAAYGLPLAPAATSAESAWVLATGARDFGLGVATLSIATYELRAMRSLAPAILLVPFADALIVLSAGGNALDAAAHGFGVVCVAVLAVCAWMDPTLARTRYTRQV